MEGRHPETVSSTTRNVCGLFDEASGEVNPPRTYAKTGSGESTYDLEVMWKGVQEKLLNVKAR